MGELFDPKSSSYISKSWPETKRTVEFRIAESLLRSLSLEYLASAKDAKPSPETRLASTLFLIANLTTGVIAVSIFLNTSDFEIVNSHPLV